MRFPKYVRCSCCATTSEQSHEYFWIYSMEKRMKHQTSVVVVLKERQTFNAFLFSFLLSFSHSVRCNFSNTMQRIVDIFQKIWTHKLVAFTINHVRNVETLFIFGNKNSFDRKNNDDSQNNSCDAKHLPQNGVFFIQFDAIERIHAKTTITKRKVRRTSNSDNAIFPQNISFLLRLLLTLLFALKHSRLNAQAQNILESLFPFGLKKMMEHKKREKFQLPAPDSTCLAELCVCVFFF